MPGRAIQRAAYGVGQGGDFIAHGLGGAQGGQGVGGFAALADGHGQGSLAGKQAGIAVFAGNVRRAFHPRQPGQIFRAHAARMVGRAAGDEINPLRRAGQQLPQSVPAPIGGQGARHGLGLLADFLEHEMGVAALFRRRRIPIHMIGRGRAPAAQRVVHPRALPPQHGDFLILQDNHIPGVGQDGGNIRGQIHFALAHADHQRPAQTHAINGVRLVFADHRQGVAALHAAHGLLHGLEHIALIQAVQQVRHHLGIRLADKLAALLQQMTAQLHVIFNDAVMHHRQRALHIHMRVRVQVAGLAVGGPAGVADAEAARKGRSGGQFFQLGDAPRAFAHADLAFFQHGDARAVIPPVFQALQPVQQNRLRLSISDVTNNSAHKSSDYCKILVKTII